MAVTELGRLGEGDRSKGSTVSAAFNMFERMHVVDVHIAFGQFIRAQHS